MARLQSRSLLLKQNGWIGQTLQRVPTCDKPKRDRARCQRTSRALHNQSMRFRTKLLSAGKTAAGIEVPTKVLESLGTSKKPPVRVTIKGHTYRSTVATVMGKYMIGVSAENRLAAGVTPGDMMDVDLEL